MKRILISMVAVGAFLAASAFTPSPQQARSQYKPYPVDTLVALTPSPDGYVPFHIEHYGRHGSRWLITNDNYDVAVRELQKAERNGKLTPKGKQVLAIVERVQADSKGRLGELTPLGAEQHKGIARRMARQFPEIFAAKGVAIDAKSTNVIRCILSMLNEMESFAAANPTAVISTDASEANMYFMNQHDPEKNAAVDAAKKTKLKEFEARRPDKLRWLNELVSDPEFIADSLNVGSLGAELYETAINMGSHGGKYPDLLTFVFSPEEIKDRWEQNNASWFLNGAMTPLTDFKAPRGQRNLANNMIESADTTLRAKTPSANLRFGHETMILSLACLMDLDGYGHPYADLEELGENWHAFDIFPMGCNIQMILYRPLGKSLDAMTEEDILVKVLLNEQERRIGILPGQDSPYYRWTDFKRALQERAK